MIISIPKVFTPGENRVAAIPATIKEYIKTGNTVQVEAGAGMGSFISDDEFKSVGFDKLNEYGILLFIQGISEVFRSIICIQTGHWPKR